MDDSVDDILYNEAALNALKRPQLQSLSRSYGLKSGGKNLELIERLFEHGKSLPNSPTKPTRPLNLSTTSSLLHSTNGHPQPFSLPLANDPLETLTHEQTASDSSVGGLRSTSRQTIRATHTGTGNLRRLSNRSRSPSPYNPFQSARFHLNRSKSGSQSRGLSRKQAGKRSALYGAFDREEEETFGEGRGGVDNGVGDGVGDWSLLSDGRASIIHAGFDSPQSNTGEGDPTAGTVRIEQPKKRLSMPGGFGEFQIHGDEDGDDDDEEGDRTQGRADSRARGGIEQVEKWKSSENGARGLLFPAGSGNGNGRGGVRMMDEFGRPRTVRSSSHAKPPSLTRRSIEHLRNLTSSFSLPLNLRKSTYKANDPVSQDEGEEELEDEEVVDPRTLNRAKSTLGFRSGFNKFRDTRKNHTAVPSRGALYDLETAAMSDPDFGRIEEPRSASAAMPTFSLGENIGLTAAKKGKTSSTPTVGVPKRHQQHSTMRKASTIRMIGDTTINATPARGNRGTSGAELLDDWGTPQSLLNELQEKGQDFWCALGENQEPRSLGGRTARLSVSPPRPSELPPLRQSTRLEDMSGMEDMSMGLGLDSVMEKTMPDDGDEGMERLREDSGDMEVDDEHSIIPSVYPSLPGDNTRGMRSSSPGLPLPGAFPSDATPKKKLSTLPAPFIFGSPAHGITNDQFSRASEAVLSEINAKLRNQGVAGIGEKFALAEEFGGSSGGQVERGMGGGKQDRYASAHQKEFAKMSSLNSKYAGKRNISGSSTHSTAPTTQPGGGGGYREKRVTKRKASAEYTPSAENGKPLRPAASTSTINNNGRRKLEAVADAVDSPRIKRMRVEVQESQTEMNGVPPSIGRSRGLFSTFASSTIGTISSVARKPSMAPDRLLGQRDADPFLVGPSRAQTPAGRVVKPLPSPGKAKTPLSRSMGSAPTQRIKSPPPPVPALPKTVTRAPVGAASMSTLNAKTGLPQPQPRKMNTGSYNKKSIGETLPYNKSSRPAPPPPGSTLAESIRPASVVKSTLYRPTAASLARAQASKSSTGSSINSGLPAAPTAISQGREGGTEENDASQGSQPVPSQFFGLSNSSAIRLRASVAPEDVTVTSISSSKEPVGIHTKPVVTVKRSQVRPSPSQSKIPVHKQRTLGGNALREAYLAGTPGAKSKESVMASPGGARSGLRSPAVAALKGKASAADLALAARQRELAARRVRIDEQRKLQELLGNIMG